MENILDHTCPFGHNIGVESIIQADYAELGDRAIAYRDPVTGKPELLSLVTGKKITISPVLYSQIWARIAHRRTAPTASLAA